ncbi:LacI family DNA-binding transcriptional regulator [Kineococcus gynurae]|uniref:LacI family DNA-binding transcriptional regulator n=1 Tax=Kineococcus gynurae TaxID=452979 RepID=A0ABV5LMR6_9ACTN
MAGRASIKDVAAAAGVSIKTVSRVVNGVSTVDAGMRERVEQAVRDLHYVPNSTARSLKSGAGNTIGVIVDSIDDVFFSSLISAIEESALSAGLGVVIGSTGHDPDRERDQVLRMTAQNVRGIILAPVSDRLDALEPYRPVLPVVAVDRKLADRDSVTIDDHGAARSAVAELLAAGHRRIALLGWDPDFSTSQDRRRGYEDALREKGIEVDPDLVPLVPYRDPRPTQALRSVLDLTAPPTALFLGNARLAAGAIAATHTLGRTDLALISFGDFLLADSVDPSVSCIDQDPYEIGELALRRLLELLEDPQSPARQHIVPTAFIPRTSHTLTPRTLTPEGRTR